MHRIERRENAKKRHLTDYRCDGGPWFRAENLYDAARKLAVQGVTGPAQSFAANGTLSFDGTIEAWCQLQVVERTKGGIKVTRWSPPPIS
jgi:hypothetical protein